MIMTSNDNDFYTPIKKNFEDVEPIADAPKNKNKWKNTGELGL